MDDLTGRTFGQYELGALIGAGGMATVYQAYQPAVDRFVAVKILSRHLTADSEFGERFRHEARTVAQFQHPHVVPVFDFGDTDGYTFLVMPLIRGGSLADLIGGLPVSLALAVRVVREVAEALDYAHSKGVIHRDIKPSNILLDEGGNCLVADFGVAQMADRSAKLTVHGTVIGTPAYMSPEQVNGEPVGPESDIYSLGVVLYEMLTGRVPFNAETPIGTALKHLTASAPRPRSVNPSLGSRVEGVVIKSMARAKSERFASGAALVSALAAAVGPAVMSSSTAARRLSPARAANADVAVTRMLPPPKRVPPSRWVGLGAVMFASTVALGPAPRAGSPSTLSHATHEAMPSIDAQTTTMQFDTPAPWQAILNAAGRSDYAAVERAFRELPPLQRGPVVDPPRARRENAKALNLIAEGRYLDAVTVLQTASALDSSDAEITGNLADALMHLGRMDEAMAMALISLRLNPTRSISWGLLGFLYAKRDDQPAAVSSLTTGYHYSSNDSKTLQVYRRMADTDADPRVRAVMQSAVRQISPGQP